jgi:hypothetical protein
MPLPLAAVAAAPLASAITILGLLAPLAWLAWRFGPTVSRITGWCSWWVAWACGSQDCFAYCVVFVVLGALAWGGGTIWYANRRGRWPSPVSARLFAVMLGKRNPLARAELTAGTSVPRPRR